jgi:MurNAc alpha-1-phosphate uridylyltransferase
VQNPPFHPGGDFGIDAQGRVRRDVEPKLTYANLALFRARSSPMSRRHVPAAAAKFEEAIDRGALRGACGTDVGEPGTPAQLRRTAAALNLAANPGT